jgi:hypothetical protein
MFTLCYNTEGSYMLQSTRGSPPGNRNQTVLHKTQLTFVHAVNIFSIVSSYQVTECRQFLQVGKMESWYTVTLEQTTHKAKVNTFCVWTAPVTHVKELSAFYYLVPQHYAEHVNSKHKR